MFKVIIVDDEPFVIEGLLEMVSWKDYGFKVSGVASDGESALELIRAVQPDVVFTDIRMPCMDGLELMDETRRLIDKDIIFIVLSGYSEFDYIKRAMDLKSFTYMLKPIDPDAISEELVKLKTRLEQKVGISERFEESVELVLGMTMERLCSGQIKPSLIGRAKFLMDLSQKDVYLLGLASNDINLENLIVDERRQHVIFSVQDNDHYFIMWGSRQFLQERILHIEDQCIGAQASSYVYLTNIQLSLSNIDRCFQILDSYRRYRFYECFSFMIVEEEMIFSKDFDRISHNSLFRLMTKPDKSEIDYQLSVMFHELREKKVSPDVLKLKFEVFIDWMQQQIDQTYGYERFKDFKQFKQACKISVAYYFQHIDVVRNNDVVNQVRQYIDNHMNEDLKLKTVARFFGYNPVYLGQIFLKDTGVKYKDFINGLRMDKAKELLLYSSLRIKEVAYEVGFNNPDYFVKKFKEYEGVSPSEYRL